MTSNLAIGPLTHTVSYAGQRFKVAQEQAAGIAKAMSEARLGLVTMLGMPVSDAEIIGQTQGRYILIGPGIPVMIEGPALEIGPKE